MLGKSEINVNYMMFDNDQQGTVYFVIIWNNKLLHLISSLILNWKQFLNWSLIYKAIEENMNN